MILMMKRMRYNLIYFILMNRVDPRCDIAIGKQTGLLQYQAVDA